MIREKMQNIQMKRVVILSIPYLIIFYLADKCFWLYRHCMGRSMIEKICVMLMNFPLAFANWFPSFYLQDLLGGVIVALFLESSCIIKRRMQRSSGMERSMDQPGGEIGKISNHLKIRYLRTILF